MMALQLQPRVQRQEHMEARWGAEHSDTSNCQVSGNAEGTGQQPGPAGPFCALFCLGRMGTSRLVQHIPQARTFSSWGTMRGEAGRAEH